MTKKELEAKLREAHLEVMRLRKQAEANDELRADLQSMQEKLASEATNRAERAEGQVETLLNVIAALSETAGRISTAIATAEGDER